MKIIKWILLFLWGVLLGLVGFRVSGQTLLPLSTNITMDLEYYQKTNVFTKVSSGFEVVWHTNIVYGSPKIINTNGWFYTNAAPVTNSTAVPQIQPVDTNSIVPFQVYIPAAGTYAIQYQWNGAISNFATWTFPSPIDCTISNYSDTSNYTAVLTNSP